MKAIEVFYEKMYTDDTGKHVHDLFTKHNPSVISYKQLWGQVVDGFMICNNSNLILLATEGNLHVVIAISDMNGGTKFEDYFISCMDGKGLVIPKGVKYAVRNIDTTKSAILIGSYVNDLNFTYTTKNIYNWRRKLV